MSCPVATESIKCIALHAAHSAASTHTSSEPVHISCVSGNVSKADLLFHAGSKWLESHQSRGQPSSTFRSRLTTKSKRPLPMDSKLSQLHAWCYLSCQKSMWTTQITLTRICHKLFHNAARQLAVQFQPRLPCAALHIAASVLSLPTA